MTNLEVLELAEKLMRASNYACNYQTFQAIVLDKENEYLYFHCELQFLNEAFKISSLLNLSLSTAAPGWKLT